MKLDFTNSVEEATLKIYDYVGKYEEVNTETIQEQLNSANGKPLNIYINSYGGEVFEGFAIYNMLERYTGYKTVYIDGIGASIASVIAMCGNKIIMNEASMLMIHNASGCAVGTFKEMEQVAEALKKINEVIRNVYKAKTNLTDEKLTELMDNESYLTAEECLQYGFADEIVKEQQDKEKTDVATNKLFNQLDERIKVLQNLKEMKAVNTAFSFEEKKDEDSIKTVDKVVSEKPQNKLKKFFNIKEER